MRFYCPAWYIEACGCTCGCAGTGAKWYGQGIASGCIFTDQLHVIEALILLIALTPESPELQKVVAFENAFERIFALIEAEGSLTHGSAVVEDCLSLLANLLKLNVSNQSYFRETGCVQKVAALLAGAAKDQEADDGVPEWTMEQRDKNVWGVLMIVDLFLVRGGLSTPINQTAFWQHGVMEQVLHLAFNQEFAVNIKAKVCRHSALRATAFFFLR